MGYFGDAPIASKNAVLSESMWIPKPDNQLKIRELFSIHFVPMCTPAFFRCSASLQLFPSPPSHGTSTLFHQPITEALFSVWSMGSIYRKVEARSMYEACGVVSPVDRIS